MVERIETLNRALTVEYHESGVIVYRLTAFTREAIDLWVSWEVEEMQQAIEKGYVLRSLIDISAASYPSPYFISKMTEIMQKAHDDLEKVTGVLVTRGMENISQLRLVQSLSRGVHLQAFPNEANAMRWLLQN